MLSAQKAVIKTCLPGRQTLRIMKISVVLIIVCLQVSAAGSGIAQTVSLSENKASLKKIFAEINRQTGYEFLYSSETLAQASSVTIDVKDAPLEEVLSICFRGQPLTYVISDKTIVVKASDSPVIPVPKEATVIKVTGTVKDKVGAPMPAVNIVVKGTTIGTSADSEGRYEIQAEENDVLVFSFIGFKTQEQQIGARILIDVVLEEDITSLGEVTISGGYYETTDKLKTGSIVKVTSKEIENQPVTSPLMALQGRVAGLDITPNSGTPGNAPIIRVRGTNSLRIGNDPRKGGTTLVEGNYPLYVIDGVPISSTSVTSYVTGGSLTEGGYDPISTINPDNIASVEVLKDGDATAIYGSRGANGVILITTKRNLKDLDRTNFNMKVYFGVGEISRKVNLLNTPEYVTMRKEARANEGTPLVDLNDYDLTKWDTTRYTDWQKVLLNGSANITDIQGSISSGNKNISFTLGGMFHRETLLTPGNFGYVKGAGNLSVNHASPNQKFKAAFAANYGVDVSDMFSGDFMSAALSLPPNAPSLYDQNGNLNWEIHELGNDIFRSTWNNPMSFTLKATEAQNRNLVSSGNISYDLLPGLSVSASLGFTDFTGSEKKRSPISSFAPSSFDQPAVMGSATFSDTKRSSWIIEPKTSYAKQWNSHGLEIIIGTTWQQSQSLQTIVLGTDYVSDALLGSLKGAGQIDILNDAFTVYKYYSFYGRAGYNFNDRYLLNLTVRRDGSSRFGPNNRFGNFWAIGGAWIFSGENFVKNSLPFLNFGKVRGSYGLTGSDNIGDYKYYNLWDIRGNRYQGIPGFVPDALYNPEYRWELTKKLEFAIELSFFQNRISTEVNWYRNLSSNQLVDYQLPATTGFPSVLQNFDAVVLNTGFEILLKGEILNSNVWRWNVSLNVSLPRNELLKFDGIEKSPYSTIYKVGEPLSIQWLYTYKGVNPYTGLYEFEDKNNDGTIDDLDKTLLNAMDKNFYGGLINTVQYKQFELSVLTQFVSKNANLFYSSRPPGTISNQPVAVMRRWQYEGDVTSTQRFGVVDVPQPYNQVRQSNFNIADASFFRLKTLSLSWTLPSSWSERIKLQYVKMFLQGQNLFTITKYQGLDPETGSALPPLRIVTVGMQIKL